ncbi:Poly(3-hydroxyalkanoate) polymerase (plasmid) [Methylocella tundrae]|uniref:Poly(3-hydroxyalkanoate) polymerase n=1 Tax=Methylocella tundrae TaxID=227605 RepID=A0A4U8Z6M6_METTU|nr:Poly(3-hydroxyalkanoate) polymerase [Methylocella tundrae]
MENTIASGTSATSIAPKAENAPLASPLTKTGPDGAPVTPSATVCPPDPLERLSETLDKIVHSSLARLTAGLSPAAMAEAYSDWAIHLAFSPGKQAALAGKAARKWARLATNIQQSILSGGRCEACIEPLPQDRRFAAKEWQDYPYNAIYQNFLLQQQWWHNATTGIDGVSKQHERVVEFTSRQLLDVASPANFLATNPVALRRTLETGGINLFDGLRNFWEDWGRVSRGEPPVGTENFKVGLDVAVTPGEVIFRNRLIELIQYAPATETVRPEPILIVPAWIMKYYILDLSPQNSLVNFLTKQGFTVFMISWKNPTEEDRDLGMEDYLRLGFLAALDAVNAIAPDAKTHAVGYCLGGTLLSAAAAAMARDGDNRLKSVSFFAAQQDFTESGELSLFINESEVHFIEDLMWEQGYLDGKQMAGAFQILRSNDLIWSRIMREYLMGERAPMNDLMAWNADATRMPYRMHSEYLRKLFLDNDLAEGRFKVAGRPIALTDIRAPIFSVGTERDHVAPWRSAFKVHLLTDTDVTFLLTTGGHNAGIVSEPGHRGRSYQILTKAAQDRHIDPDAWQALAPRKEGSWWPEWTAWLAGHSGKPVTPPRLGAPQSGYTPLCAAPGSYVQQP